MRACRLPLLALTNRTEHHMAATLDIAAANNKNRIAVAFPRRPNCTPHEMASHEALTRKLAGALKLDFVPDYQPEATPSSGGVYFVPAQTLVRATATQEVQPYCPGIYDVEGLFGGVVPYEFV